MSSTSRVHGGSGMIVTPKLGTPLSISGSPRRADALGPRLKEAHSPVRVSPWVAW
jgi:hypothetical protein